MINEESLTEPFNPVINDRELSLSLSLSLDGGRDGRNFSRVSAGSSFRKES